MIPVYYDIILDYSVYTVYVNARMVTRIREGRTSKGSLHAAKWSRLS